jgi:hypothetical protein
MSDRPLLDPGGIEQCLKEAEYYRAAFHTLGNAISARRKDPQPDSFDDLCELEKLFAELNSGTHLA